MNETTKIKIVDLVKKLLNYKEIEAKHLPVLLTIPQIQREEYNILNIYSRLELGRNDFLQASQNNHKQFDEYVKHRICQNIILELIKRKIIDYVFTEDKFGDKYIIESKIQLIDKSQPNHA